MSRVYNTCLERAHPKVPDPAGGHVCVCVCLRACACARARVRARACVFLSCCRFTMDAYTMRRADASHSPPRSRCLPARLERTADKSQRITSPITSPAHHIPRVSLDAGDVTPAYRWTGAGRWGDGWHQIARCFARLDNGWMWRCARGCICHIKIWRNYMKSAQLHEIGTLHEIGVNITLYLPHQMRVRMRASGREGRREGGWEGGREGGREGVGGGGE